MYQKLQNSAVVPLLRYLRLKVIFVAAPSPGKTLLSVDVDDLPFFDAQS